MPTDEQIARRLIRQVADTVPPGENERVVTTIITRPMFDAWQRAWGNGAILGKKWTSRIYGSKTIVVESPIMRSVSFVDPNTNSA